MTTAATPAAAKPAETKGPVIDLTLDSSDDDDDDAVIPSDPVSPPPVINLDTPSPAPLPNMPGSPTVVLSNSQSSSPSPAVPSHPPSLFQSSHAYTGPAAHSTNHSNSQDSSLNVVDNILQAPSNIAQTSPSSLHSEALNLEAMSDADFDEFLKGLSWGV